MKEREREIETLEKQLREMNMTLQMKRQRETELSDEAHRQIEETRREKDGQIHTLVQRCLTERETLLFQDIKDSREKNEEALERMRNGYLEDHVEKGKHLQDLSEIHESGHAQRSGQEERGPGTGPKDITLRCAKPLTLDDDQQDVFNKRKQKHKDTYGDMEKWSHDAKAQFRENREQAQLTVRQTKELRDRIARESAEREREVKRLTEKVAAEKGKQQQYELENQKLFNQLQVDEKQLKALEGEIAKGARPSAIKKLGMSGSQRPKAITDKR